MRAFRAGDGAELWFSETGNGEPALLFLHGWQADRSVWDEIIAQLCEDFRCIAVDLRGSGASSGAPGPYRLEQFADDLRVLVQFLGLSSVVAVGHSMGGTTALRFAVDAPVLVKGLVLVAPVPPSDAGFSEKRAAYLRATAGNPVAVRQWLTRTFAAPPPSHALDSLCRAAARTRREAALESFESWGFADFAKETRCIAAPVLVIAPSDDAPERTQSNVAALLRDGSFEIVPECGHYAIVERPQAIAALVRQFAIMEKA